MGFEAFRPFGQGLGLRSRLREIKVETEGLTGAQQHAKKTMSGTPTRYSLQEVLNPHLPPETLDPVLWLETQPPEPPYVSLGFSGTPTLSSSKSSKFLRKPLRPHASTRNSHMNRTLLRARCLLAVPKYC